MALLTVLSQDIANCVSPVPALILEMHLIYLLQPSAEVYDEQEILDIARKVTKHVVPIFSRPTTGFQHAQGLVRHQGPKCCHSSLSRNAGAVHSVEHFDAFSYHPNLEQKLAPADQNPFQKD